MLRLPQMAVVAPESVAEVIDALATPGARIVAGGTDIIPNLKHRLDRPPVLVSLSRVRELRTVVVDEDAGVLRVGAGMTLTEVSRHPDVQRVAPSLAEAAGIVASPLIRNMATIGGNVNLDVRCRYVNQTEFWRAAIHGCLKAEGDVCHVVPGGKLCVAAMSSDCVPVLVSLDAALLQVGPSGPREVAVADYYRSDGRDHIAREDGELTTEIRVPLPAGPRRSAYAKWTVRRSIDFPLVSIALRFDLDGDSVDAAITGHRVCVGVLGVKPRVVSRIDVLGMKLSDRSVPSTVAEAVHKQCKPLENVPYEAPYRRKMLRVHTRRAIEALVASG